MCSLQWCLYLVLWQKEKEKPWGLVASSGHHSCWNQKGNPVLVINTQGLCHGGYQFSERTQLRSVNKWGGKMKDFSQWFGTVRCFFLELKADQAFSQHLSCLYLISTLRLDAAGVQLQSARGRQWWSSLAGGRESAFCLLSQSVASSPFPKFP